MNFELNEEQSMLRDSVARFIQDDYDWETRKATVAMEGGFDPAHWQTFAELGWLSIPFAEAQGGFGGGPVDLMAVMEEFGKGLVAEPFMATVLLFGGVLAKAGNAPQQALIEQIIGGKLQGALAYLERDSRYDLNHVATTAEADGGHYTLNGTKTVVFNGHSATHLIVTARTSGDVFDSDGISFFLVETDAPGLSRESWRLMDGQQVANIRLDDVKVEASALIGEAHTALPTLQSVIDTATIAVCAEAVGIMHSLTHKTVEYTKTRKQFGVAISSFQALQHRMVDMLIDVEQTRSLLYRAVCAMDEGSGDAARCLAALKMKVGTAGKTIGAEAVQIHGGMGMTDELDIGHYMKRLMLINMWFGDFNFHQQRFAQLSYG